MRKLSLSLLALSLALVGLPASAVTVVTPPPAGVTFGVTTAGYQFTPTIGTVIPPGGGTGTTLPQGFAAGVTLENHTTQAIPFTIDAGIKFDFSVYDAKGNKVWDSVPAVLPQFVELLPLPAGASWHGSAFVPLFLKGKPLPAGTYTLDVSVFGSPVFAATTTFVVNKAIAIN